MTSDEFGPGFLARSLSTVRALRYRNYKLFFFGQGTSLIGTWMQRIALSWLVYRLTGSEMLLGIVGFCGHILTVPVAPLAGVLADRVNRRGLLVATQTAAMLQAFLLAALTLTGTLNVWHIVVLSMVLGVINAFDIPIRQSFVVEMVDAREDLPNAIALNSFLVNGAKLLGPSLAGILIGLVGEGVCFLLNGISFIGVVAALLAMQVKPWENHAPPASVLQNLSEGLRYVLRFGPIRTMLLLIAMVSFLGLPYTLVMPVFAKDILRGDARTLGFLMAATGVGAIGATLFLAFRKSVRGLGHAMILALSLFGAALIAFTLSRNLWVSLGLLTVAGFGLMTYLASANTLIQTVVDDDKRGRVMSFYTVALLGVAPFGNLLAGWLASRLGAPWGLSIGGAGCILAAAIFATRRPLLAKRVHVTYADVR